MATSLNRSTLANYPARSQSCYGCVASAANASRKLSQRLKTGEISRCRQGHRFPPPIEGHHGRGGFSQQIRKAKLFVRYQLDSSLSEINAAASIQQLSDFLQRRFLARLDGAAEIRMSRVKQVDKLARDHSTWQA